jgi:AcrR family transcriptional regulator
VSADPAPDHRLTPLEAVTQALERAVALSELTPQQLEWSMTRLGHRAQRASGSKAGDRRQEIVSAGARVFLRRGYLNATMEEVARELSLTKAAIYHYFRSKEALMDAIIEASLETVETDLAEAFAGAGDPAEGLRRALELCIDRVLDDEGTRVLLRNLDELSGAASPEAARRCRRIRSLLVRQLEEGQAEGLFEPVDPTVTVLSLMGAVSWLSTWYDPAGPRTRARVREVLIAQLLAGIQAPGAAP